MKKKRLVVFSGAGISAESGINTFRDSGGLWEKHKIEDVATLEAFDRNPALVLDFYNQRRRRIKEVEPNQAHLFAAKLEQHFDVSIITQNIDDLHERAGSTKVIHLHGEITFAKPRVGDGERKFIGYNDINLGDLDKNGYQLRPDIVWFGEAVPKYDEGLAIVQKAEILIVVGTSLNVYPAAGLVYQVPSTCKNYLIDPNFDSTHESFELIKEPATSGMEKLVQQLIHERIN